MHFVICKYYQGLGSSRALRAAVVEASLRAPFNMYFSPFVCLSTPRGWLYLHFTYVRKECRLELPKRVFFLLRYARVAICMPFIQKFDVFTLRYKNQSHEFTLTHDIKFILEI